MPRTPEVELLSALLEHQLREHPLPWSIERDWAYEVHAADGTIICKFMRPEQASDFIALAERSHKATVEACDTADAMLDITTRG